ncbi:MAG TPA: hypothetical protein PLF22_10230 [Pseudomonadales bacterium]|nr:hypothetical protein [Pseudomonadales bacterium]
MAIPAEYQFFAVNYVGENVWAGIKRKEPATLETPIEGFGIRVKLPDLQPANTPALLAEWQQITRTSAFYPWLEVSVSSMNAELTRQKWDHLWIEAWGLHRPSPGCHYQKTEERRFGLSVERLVCDNQKLLDMHSSDFLYDESEWKTIIICETRPTPRHICQHFFPIPEMQADIKFSFYPENLEDWKTNQEKITVLLKSFIVQSSK